MKFSYSLLAIILLQSAQAAVTIRFSDATNSLTGLGDFMSTTATNGLAWGIVVDGDKDGFSTFIATAGLKIEDGADLGTNDFFYYGGSTVTVPGTQGGAGGAVLLSAADVYENLTGSSGFIFGIVWFETGPRNLTEGSLLLPGDHYGLLQNPSGFILPPDGDNVNYSTLFPGSEDVRAANLTMIPEPSSALMVFSFLGISALLTRRR
ncbi:hypothetical protein [Haloferula sp.]|uniref:hypothetical protein n=1 Tax=Haloferula sp. TaxID=2497595 RepID=UPI003C709D78